MLRAATEEDRDRVRQWRNHPTVRRSSLTTHEIGSDEHRAWWQDATADPCREILIYCHEPGGGVPAGVVMFADIDPDAGSATWGYYLDYAGLQERGELLPAWLELERDAVDHAFDVLGLARLGGETLAWNTQVLQLHKRFGFVVTDTYQRDVDGEPQQVVWTELTADARRR